MVYHHVATGRGKTLRIPVPGWDALVPGSRGWLLYIDPPRMQSICNAAHLAEKRVKTGCVEQLAPTRVPTIRPNDGIEVSANQSGSEAEAHAVRNGAEGSGLLRTEFLFLERTAPPDEAEQLDQYQQIASALEGRPLTIRTSTSAVTSRFLICRCPTKRILHSAARRPHESLETGSLAHSAACDPAGTPDGPMSNTFAMITDVGEIRAIRRCWTNAARRGYLEPSPLEHDRRPQRQQWMADRIAARPISFG